MMNMMSSSDSEVKDKIQKVRNTYMKIEKKFNSKSKIHRAPKIRLTTFKVTTRLTRWPCNNNKNVQTFRMDLFLNMNQT